MNPKYIFYVTSITDGCCYLVTSEKFAEEGDIVTFDCLFGQSASKIDYATIEGSTYAEYDSHLANFICKVWGDAFIPAEDIFRKEAK